MNRSRSVLLWGRVANASIPALLRWRTSCIFSALLLAGMRWFNADALQGVKLHFLGATVATLMFGEGFFCGGAMALVVVYRPQWCASFDDARYLRSR